MQSGEPLAGSQTGWGRGGLSQPEAGSGNNICPGDQRHPGVAPCEGELTFSLRLQLVVRVFWMDLVLGSWGKTLGQCENVHPLQVAQTPQHVALFLAESLADMLPH
ncbi:unnamed protein product [Arctogadus glacialis]